MMLNQSTVLDLHLLSNFIHQIVNPLNGVIGTLDNIIDGTVPEAKRDQRLKAVRAQLEWSVLLIRNLAYFTQMSLKPGTPTGTDVAKTCVLPQLVIEAAQFFQEPGLTRGIRIHLEDRATQYTVTGSPDLLRQVFMNLFDNAVKYGDADSDIRIKPWVQKRTNTLIVEVQSKGIGFHHDESEKLFDVGYRGREAQSRVASGTGLGLYICRRIMEDIHQGTIEVEYSKESRLTTFRLRFPEWSKK